ncbi:MAG: exodeoxyribonuclease VII small subunit [Candidatus Obscuribacterales bacterium]|nr:exodeoxyribonuclease VII small subunit [Candidatus Obscuribacterales bacterium]
MTEKNRRSRMEEAGTQLSLPISDDGAKKDMSVDKGQDFEATLMELEKVVQALEGEVKLEEALKLFDRGMQLSSNCETFLKDAEQKIEILKKAANGTLTSEKFSEESIQSS